MVTQYLPSLIGGLMLSASTSTWLVNDGRVLGISGLAHSVVKGAVPSASKASAKDARAPGWKYAAVAGLIAGGAVLQAYSPQLASITGRPVFDSFPALDLSRIILAGLATGVGTKLGSGCTSGHMLCGLARLSKRSLVATLTFFSVALATAHISPSPLPLNVFKSAPALTLSSVAALQIPLVLANVLARIFARPTSEPLVAFLTGVHFSFSLALAGMLRPSTVISFFYLPIPGLPTPIGRAWDPSLMFVALGGLLPNALVWQQVKNWSKPLLNNKWELPTRKDVDSKLVLGAALFGLGWGSMGICPGPLLAVLGSATSLNATLPFAAAFAAGGIAVDALT